MMNKKFNKQNLIWGLDIKRTLVSLVRTFKSFNIKRTLKIIELKIIEDVYF